MGKRTWIDSDIWSDTEDLTNEERTLYLYLLTCDHRNIAGYYEVNFRHMAFDLGVSRQKLEKMLSKEQKYWIFDKETKQVLLPKFTKYNIVKSPPQIARLNADLNNLKPCVLHKRFLEAFTEVNGIGAEDLIDEKFKRAAGVYI